MQSIYKFMSNSTHAFYLVHREGMWVILAQDNIYV
jgi:hypothetical protein